MCHNTGRGASIHDNSVVIPPEAGTLGATHRMTATALLKAHGQIGFASGGTCGVSGLRPSGLREAKECHWGWALTAITLLSHRYSPGNSSTKERSAKQGAKVGTQRQGR
jgi:hypothetical protein